MGLFDKDLLTSQSQFEMFVEKLQKIVYCESLNYPVLLNTSERDVVFQEILNETFHQNLDIPIDNFTHTYKYRVTGLNIVRHYEFMGEDNWEATFSCWNYITKKHVIVRIKVFGKGSLKTKIDWK